MTAYKKWNEHSGQVLNSVKGFDVIECEHCRFKHIVPIPTAEKLEMVYREDYYTKEKPLYIERSKEDEEWWNMVYAERYDKFEELLPSNRRKILDVGCGPGFFLAHGLNRGWETLGLEPSAKAAAHARSLGTKVKEEFLTEGLAKDLGQFDVVHMSKMLEHVPNPKEIILTARDLVSDSGLVYVDVPNDYNPFQQALVKACNYKPWWVAPPHHINYFNYETLSNLLENSGFKVVHKGATFPIDMFLLMGDNYVGNDELGRACHGKRKSFEQNLEAAEMRNLKAKLYKYFAQTGIGREIIIIGTKIY